MMNQIIRYKTVIDYIRKYKPRTILEVGSGSKGIGKFMRNLKFTGLDMTSSDYSQKELKTSRNMTFVYGDSLHIPFENESFDLCFSLDMLEHIQEKDRIQAVKEVIRVAKNTAIIGFPYGKFGSLIDQIFMEYYLRKNGKLEGWLKEHIENGVPDKNLIEEVKKQGYTITEIDNGNIWFLIFIILMEQKLIFNIFLVPLSYLIAYLPVKFDSPYGVRKYIVVHKK